MPETTVFLPLVDAYDRWSAFYDRYDNPMVFGAWQIVRGIAERVAGQAVVEFGCGTGRNLQLLKQSGARSVAGCDLSAGMLARAREHDPALVLFHQDMAQPLPLADGVADLVLFSLALEHVAVLTPPLREAKRLLSSNGKIVLIEIHPFLTLSNVAAHFRDEGTVVTMPTFPHGFSDYLNAADESGLHIAACREWRPRDFDGPVPEKVLKRGPDVPLIVEFVLQSSSRA
ncbi:MULTISPECIES: class I SAM-dependent methyltransferase [unclassified Bradyrhizobium]|nr:MULTISPECIES: class I SAM-dependent methyltransferase [unclassified Bradyrhizobium]